MMTTSPFDPLQTGEHSSLEGAPVDVTDVAQERRTFIEGVEVNVCSHRVGARYGAYVEAMDGAIVSRARGATREEAESTAMTSASIKLCLASARGAIQACRQTVSEQRASQRESSSDGERRATPVTGPSSDPAQKGG